MTRVDFSRNAAIYDRRHGATLSRDDANRLITTAGLAASAEVLDVGAGTGRVAHALSVSGLRVVALEPSTGMLEQLRIKAPAARTLVGEATRLPFRDRTFAAVVLARLLYLIPSWRTVLNDARRVLMDRSVILHEWGNGESDEEWVQVREETRRLFESSGVQSPFHPGVRTRQAVDDYMPQIGFVRETAVSFGPGPRTTLRNFVRQITTGELSYVWNVPEAVQADCLPRLERWAETTFDLDQPLSIPRQVEWTIFRKND